MQLCLDILEFGRIIIIIMHDQADCSLPKACNIGCIFHGLEAVDAFLNQRIDDLLSYGLGMMLHGKYTINEV